MDCCPSHIYWFAAHFGRCYLPGDQSHPEDGGRPYLEASAEVALPLPPQTLLAQGGVLIDA